MEGKVQEPRFIKGVRNEKIRDVVQYRFGVPMNLLRQAYALRINTRENEATGHGGILSTCNLEGHELLNLVGA